MRRRLATGAFALVTVVAALAVASPAVGGPSALKVAKKALKVGKKADKRARAARKVANSALTKANAVGAVTRVNGPKTTIAADDADHSIATCPAGQRAISGGGEAITAGGLSVTEPTSSGTGWFVIGYSPAVSGTIQATALCAPSGRAVTANQHSITQQVEAKEAKVRAVLRDR